MAHKTGVALIGFGYWGPNYARVLNELPTARLVAVCDRDADRLDLVRSRYPAVELCTQIDEVFTRRDVEAVVISTPASTHAELVRQALAAGRHVLVEKPMALDLETCDELCDQADAVDRVLLVGYTFLYNSAVHKMKECMAADEFGDVYYLHATRTNLGPIRGDVNAFWDLAPHDIAIFNYLLGQEPQWASAIGSRVLRNSRYDIGFATLGYANNVIANVHISWADPNKVREVVAVGSKRRVVFNDLSDAERVRLFERGVSVGEDIADSFGEFKLLMRDGDIISPKVAPSEPLKNQCLDFIESIQQKRRPSVDCRFARGVVRALLAIGASACAGGARQEI